jgi:tetratricopeptide (TPR) repeat protein
MVQFREVQDTENQGLESQIDIWSRDLTEGGRNWLVTPKLQAFARIIISSCTMSLNSAKVLHQAADVCCDEAYYAEAQHFYGEAISRFEAFGDHSSTERSKCYLGRGLCAWFLHNYDTAEEEYDRAMMEVGPSDSLQYADCLVHAAGLDLIRQCFVEAKSNLNRAETLLGGRETTDVFAWMLHNRGRVLLAEHLLSESRLCFQRSLRILETNHGRDRRDMIHGLCNLIRIFALEKDFAAGHRCKVLAEQCLEKYAGHNQLFAGLFLAHCGVLSREEGKCEEAKEHFVKSLDQFERRNREDPSKAYALIEFAILEFASRGDNRASQLTQHARKIYAKFLGEASLSVARCDVLHGKIALQRGQCGQAQELFTKAFGSLRHLVSEQHPDLLFIQNYFRGASLA